MASDNREIIYNPSLRQFLKALKAAEVGTLKGIVDVEGNVYLGDSYYMMHEDIHLRSKLERYVGAFELWMAGHVIIYGGHIRHLEASGLAFLKEADLDFPENTWKYKDTL